MLKNKVIRVIMLSLVLLLTVFTVGCSRTPDKLMSYINKTELTLTNLENVECIITHENLENKETCTYIIKKDKMYKEYTITPINGTTSSVEKTWISYDDNDVLFKYVKKDSDPIYSVKVEEKFETVKEEWIEMIQLGKDILPESSKNIKEGGTPNKIEYTDKNGKTAVLNLTKWKSLSTGVDGYHIKEYTVSNIVDNKAVETLKYKYRYPWEFTSSEIPEIK